MAFNKILDSDKVGKGVVGLPDVPGLSTGQMQEKFDELANYCIERINQLIDELSAPTAAANVGSADGTVQIILDRLLGYAEDLTNSKADVNNVLARDNTLEYTPAGDYQPATKKYVDDKLVAIGAGDMAQSVYDPQGKRTDIFAEVEQARSYAEEVANNVGGTVNTHVSNTSNPHSVSKAQVGLDKVNNNNISMSASGTTLNITFS